MQPEGFVVKDGESFVLKLKKALYGLKQAPRAWYFKLPKCLVSLGFSRSKNEQVVCLKWSDKSHLIIGVYVDDLLVTSENDSDINEFIYEMMYFFEISDLGQLCSYLGIEVAQGGARIPLSQRAYALNILDLARMRECNLVHAPLEARVKLSQQNSGSSQVYEASDFRTPLSDQAHSKICKSTIDYGLVYEKGQTEATLVGYIDSNFVGDVGD
ncbi:unnamed protein product [Spirodela intermedia]|uniref:Reverse transcriptase Ty1/copia-type domain-containing protein n=1 Tax=Spirodela intermedia TaxID=51605 RepID=A0A7I8K4Z4_SPIIN|nr:unnamed protein product [Spirodela intermedia]